jgi:hypothetical protein
MLANVTVAIGSAGREHHGLARASLEIAAGAGRKAAGSSASVELDVAHPRPRTGRRHALALIMTQMQRMLLPCDLKPLSGRRIGVRGRH